MAEMIRIAVCVDDTDDLTKSTSTGAVAEAIARCVVELGGLVELGVSRHQLLLDGRVPYTSHNSSMAMTAKLPVGRLDELRERARSCVLDAMAASADPGLCVAQLPDDGDDALLLELVAFGLQAKADYIAKAEAYELAARIPWLTLEELGGDGQGVVGALAGVGLRLSGNDGRFRGRWDLAALCEGRGEFAHGKNDGKKRGRGDGFGSGHGRGDGSGGGHGQGRHRLSASGGAGGATDVAEGAISAYRATLVCERVEAATGGRAMVVDVRGERVPADTPVFAVPDAKPVLLAGRLAIVVERGADGIARPCAKDALGELGNGTGAASGACPAFEFDNDLEEFGAAEGLRACANCLFRRWTGTGFLCMKRPATARAFSEVIA